MPFIVFWSKSYPSMHKPRQSPQPYLAFFSLPPSQFSTYQLVSFKKSKKSNSPALRQIEDLLGFLHWSFPCPGTLPYRVVSFGNRLKFQFFLVFCLCLLRLCEFVFLLFVTALCFQIFTALHYVNICT